jgi:AAA domain
VIVKAAITNRTTKALSGVDRDFAPVCADLAHGWTLAAPAYLRTRPARLRLIGRRFAYEAQLSGYRLPAGLCSCRRKPCRCQGVQLKDGDTPGVLLLISATPRAAWDGTDEDILRYPRCYEPFERSSAPLDTATLALITERWDRTHLQRAATDSDPIAQYEQLSRIRAFLAHEHGKVVHLAEQPWDPDRFAQGQLVLYTKSPEASAQADRDFVYRLPNLDMPLRVEDLSERELVIDCGEQDLVSVEQYLRAQQGRPLRLTLDSEETDRRIEREQRTLREAERNATLRALIAKPTLAKRTPEREPTAFFNQTLDPGQQNVVAAALAADDLLVVQGPPGTGKTTAICEIVRLHLKRDPRAQILLAAQTHQAVDNVLLRLAEQDPDLPIARIASRNTAERVDPLISERYWTHSPEPWQPPVVRRAYAYRRLIDSQIKAGDRTEDETLRDVLAIQEDYLASIGPQRTPSQRLAQARVIAGTCAAVHSDQEVRAMTFPLAILEEAGKATAPEALMLMLRARKSILVGDTRQLPPHVWEPMRTVLRDPGKLTTSNEHRAAQAIDIREQIAALGATPAERQAADEQTLLTHFAEHLKGTEHVATLDTQYRMLAPIGELVSQVFYGEAGRLRHARQRPVDPRVASFAQDTRVRLIDIPGRERYDGKSKHRPAEVEHVRAELRALQHHAANVGPPPEGPQRLGVAVITPYAAQARRLRAGLDLTLYPDLDVRVGIVDRFQGDEDQVVILSIAATTVAGFLKVPNRINVAISRAQDLLIVTTSLNDALAGRIGRPLRDVASFIARQVQDGQPGYEIVRPPRSRPPKRPRRAQPQPNRAA